MQNRLRDEWYSQRLEDEEWSYHEYSPNKEAERIEQHRQVNVSDSILDRFDYEN